jgi:hypothetical protein
VAVGEVLVFEDDQVFSVSVRDAVNQGYDGSAQTELDASREFLKTVAVTVLHRRALHDDRSVLQIKAVIGGGDDAANRDERADDGLDFIGIDVDDEQVLRLRLENDLVKVGREYSQDQF